jgi:hypothetical protein
MVPFRKKHILILNPLYLYKDNPIQLIYVNSLDMQIGHISTQSTYITLAPNVTSRPTRHPTHQATRPTQPSPNSSHQSKSQLSGGGRRVSDHLLRARPSAAPHSPFLFWNQASPHHFPFVKPKKLKLSTHLLTVGRIPPRPHTSSPSRHYKRSAPPWPLHTTPICVPSFPPPLSNRRTDEVITVTANTFAADPRLCLRRPFLPTVRTASLPFPSPATAGKRRRAVAAGRLSSDEPTAMPDFWSTVDQSSWWSMSHGPIPPPFQYKTNSEIPGNYHNLALSPLNFGELLFFYNLVLIFKSRNIALGYQLVKFDAFGMTCWLGVYQWITS